MIKSKVSPRASSLVFGLALSSALIATLAFSAKAAVQQQLKVKEEGVGISTTRPYKVGDLDFYRLSITTEAQGSVTAFLTHQVTKVYPSGDADILETITKLDATGQMAMPTPSPRTVRFTEFGVITGDGPKDPVTMAIFSTILPEVKGLSKDGFLTFERSLPSIGNAQIRGSARIVESNGDQVGIGVQGSILNAFGTGPAGIASFAGSLVWDQKAKHYVRGNYHVSATDPDGKKFSYTFSFERVEPVPAKTGG